MERNPCRIPEKSQSTNPKIQTHLIDRWVCLIDQIWFWQIVLRFPDVLDQLSENDWQPEIGKTDQKNGSKKGSEAKVCIGIVVADIFHHFTKHLFIIGDTSGFSPFS